MKRIIIEVIRLLLIVLFGYAATNKVIAHEQFNSTLAKLPLIDVYSNIFAFLIPGLELVIMLLLIIPRFQSYGLWLSLVVIVGFTGYLFIPVINEYELPCSCGGVISRLSWVQHLYFNLAIIMMILFTLFISRIRKHN